MAHLDNHHMKKEIGIINLHNILIYFINKTVRTSSNTHRQKRYEKIFNKCYFNKFHYKLNLGESSGLAL